ncbi:MAG: type II toxin-antitoxin system RelE/ParE family toxin [Oscillospiraceae bacterium]|nr:type II toxin-antitoxin system RelE/ParE family toxin [Oscillospiraceae bacterium]
MAFEIKRLASFEINALDIDEQLYELSANASDNFYEDYCKKIKIIEENPYLYQVFEDDSYFRSAPLVYGYRLFYHVDEQQNAVILHRIIHGSMDLAHQLGE